MNTPKRNSRHVYVGPGDGKGVVHTVTGFIDSGHAIPEIATFSDSGPTGAGFMWLGDVKDFREQFRPVPGEKQEA